ncbi:MAG: hypothetical protein IPM82_27325 [Saprospiraceae bacterium]|nr:hypothetical protein [Saprospiraceae bacterium]
MAIPMVELGEYGRDHDPEQVGPLRIEEARMQRERAQQELKQNAVALAEVAGALPNRRVRVPRLCQKQWRQNLRRHIGRRT